MLCLKIFVLKTFGDCINSSRYSRRTECGTMSVIYSMGMLGNFFCIAVSEFLFVLDIPSLVLNKDKDPGLPLERLSGRTILKLIR